MCLGTTQLRGFYQCGPIQTLTPPSPKRDLYRGGPPGSACFGPPKPLTCSCHDHGSMLYCLYYRNSRIKSNNKVLTFMWVWKSLKSVLLSPVQCSDPGHTVAHDCCCCCCLLHFERQALITLLYRASLDLLLLLCPWPVGCEPITDPQVFLCSMNCHWKPSAAQSCRWEDARLRFGKTHKKGTEEGLQWTQADHFSGSAQFDSLTSSLRYLFCYPALVSFWRTPSAGI